MPTSFLITGATGKQGRSTIESLLKHGSFSEKSHIIYAVTRDPSSASAQRLTTLSPAIKLIRGSFDDPVSVFRSLPTPPTAVFGVQLPGKKEFSQAVALIDAASNAKIQRFVQTSVERGGEGPSSVPHFATKHDIEQHLAKTAAGNNFSYTILRPVFFLDNIEWGFIGKLMMTAWRDQLGREKKLQVVDTRDIGSWAAAALIGEEASLRDAKVSLAGDDLTFAQANVIFREETGQDIPTTWSWLSAFMVWAVSDIGHMFKFFRDEGFTADIKALTFSGRPVTSFRAWAKKSSFARKAQ